MFGPSEDLNDVEALIPSEAGIPSSLDTEDSISFSENFLRNCETKFVFKGSL